MKIAFISPFYPLRGGIAQFSDSLYLSFKKLYNTKAFSFKKLYPALFFPGSSQYVLKEDIQKAVEAEFILNSMNPISYFKTAMAVIEYEPDITIISYWMPFFSISLGSVSSYLKKSGFKIISIMHNVIPHERKIVDNILTKFFLKRVDGFIILNEKSKEDLIRLKPDARYLVHPHPVYEHFGEKVSVEEGRKKLDIPIDKKVILFFGLIRQYKGLDLLIEAMKNLPEQYLLIVAGEVYGNFDIYEKIIKKHLLIDRVHLHLRYISDREVPLFFSSSDVCVLPYRSATQSGIVGLSYYYDLPVIVTNVGGLPEIVIDNKTGLIVNEPTSEAIASSIMRYFSGGSDGLGMKKLFQSHIRTYKNKFSWDNLAEKIIEFYKNIND